VHHFAKSVPNLPVSPSGVAEVLCAPGSIGLAALCAQGPDGHKILSITASLKSCIGPTLARLLFLPCLAGKLQPVVWYKSFLYGVRHSTQDQQLMSNEFTAKAGQDAARSIKDVRYYRLLLAESCPTRRLFGSMLSRIAGLSLPSEQPMLWQPKNRSGSSQRKIVRCNPSMRVQCGAVRG